VTEVAPERANYVLARVAAVLWVLPEGDLSFAEIEAKVEELLSLLDNDSRVTQTEPPMGLVSEFNDH
jgi:hypothetical protein